MVAPVQSSVTHGFYEKTSKFFGSVKQVAPLMADATEFAAKNSEKISQSSKIVGVISKVSMISGPVRLLGQGASIVSGLMGLNDHLHNAPKSESSGIEKASYANDILSTAVGVSSAALQIVSPFAPAVGPAVPVVGQIGTALWLTGMGMNAYKAYNSAAPAA